MKQLVKRLCMFVVLLGLAGAMFGQGVTTSSMTGTVSDRGVDPLSGATVVAIHLPTGTQYGTTTTPEGRFIIPNMRVGGPYKVVVSYVGYVTWEQEDIFVDLGAPLTINVPLGQGAVGLVEVTVLGRTGSVGQNSGTSTRITSDDIANLPSVNRDMNDFLRITPQARLFGGGISFAGTNNRFNAIYIDGAVNNDVFGLAGSGTNGGQTGISPFSIDIIEQFQVVISPYDVTLGGFAGGGINAVTKSGSNEFKGSIYSYFRNQSLVGKTNQTLAERLDIERTKVDDFGETSYGFSLGGPVIKDRVFFFGNVEIQRDETPRPFEISEYTSTPGRASEADLNNLRNHLINTYGYDPGTFGSTTDNLDGLKLFGKIDVNLNADHKLTLRHQYTKGEEFARYAGNSRTINYSNNGRYFPSTTNSSALELNSRLGIGYSNNLIVSYVRVRDDRNPIGDNFPYVYIDDVSSGQIRFGSEEFSTANRLDQDIISITNNFNIYRGSHTITLGTHNEFYDIYNVFIGQNFGTYRFSSLQAFLDGDPAYRYDRSYSLIDDITGDGTKAAGDFKAMQLGFYIQDQWYVNRNLTLTGGIRLDIPIITTDPEEDTYLNQTAIPLMVAHYPMAEGIVAGQAPDRQLMFSPRVGFNLDVFGDNSAILRGGAGIFTSRIPFVWPGAMFTNNGFTLGRVNQNNIVGDVLFRPDINNQYIHPNPTVPAGQIDIFTKDFKYPQVFRTNLAFDYELPWGIVSTLEGVFTKTLNNINYTNINSNPNVAFTWDGHDNRKVYVNQNIDNTYSAVYLASNTSQGYTYNLSATLAKDFAMGLSATVAYSYGDAYALSEGTSSQNSSQWRGQVNVNGRNDASFGRSDFAVGHRVLSALSYTHKWTADGNNKTTVSVFVNGQSGTPFSYIISGAAAQNLNRERGSTGRNRSLAFIPATQSQINLVDYTVGTTTVTAAEQWANLDAFIEADRYLSKNRGKYADKNGAWSPFMTIFDVALRHDLGLTVGSQTHRLQLSFDIANFGNMLNGKWGTIYSVPGDFNNFYMYQFDGYEGDGRTPRFSFRTTETGKDSFDISGLGSRWRMLLGVKYFFN